jgi:AcrR family transcriptional regulator
MTQQRKPTAERQGEILDAAARLLAREGAAALTTATLAREVGVTGGALFRHFASKEAILVALAARAAEGLRGHLTRREGESAEAGLRRFVRERLTTITEDPSTLPLVLSSDVHLALPEEGRAHLQRAIQATQRYLGGLLQEGQERGVFRRDLALPELMVAVMGVLSFLALGRTQPALPSRGVDAERLVLALVSGVSVQGEKSEERGR